MNTNTSEGGQPTIIVIMPEENIPKYKKELILSYIISKNLYSQDKIMLHRLTVYRRGSSCFEHMLMLLLPTVGNAMSMKPKLLGIH